MAYPVLRRVSESTIYQATIESETGYVLTITRVADDIFLEGELPDGSVVHVLQGYTELMNQALTELDVDAFN